MNHESLSDVDIFLLYALFVMSGGNALFRLVPAPTEPHPCVPPTLFIRTQAYIHAPMCPQSSAAVTAQ